VKSFCVCPPKNLFYRAGIRGAKINKLKINQRVKNLRGELMFYFYNLTGKEERRQVHAALHIYIVVYA